MSIHDESLRKVFGVGQATIVNRILATFERATSTDLESGARWYDEAGNLAASFAATSGLSIEQASSVIAALSPRTTWARNVAAASALLSSGPAAARKLGAMSRNVETARVARRDGFDALNGPKTNAFARNIAGDREAVTVDVWAMRVAALDENLLARKGAYDAMAHCYRLAARRAGVDPATMQAVTWIVARNGRAS